MLLHFQNVTAREMTDPRGLDSMGEQAGLGLKSQQWAGKEQSN